MKKIAIPSQEPGGLTAMTSAHFGRAPMYTLVNINDGQVQEVKVMENVAHESGGCHGPVNFLASMGVTDVLVMGLGRGPLNAFAAAQINLFKLEAEVSVSDAVQLYLKNSLAPFAPGATCGHCHH